MVSKLPSAFSLAMPLRLTPLKVQKYPPINTFPSVCTARRRQERTATLKELDVITKKAIDQTSEKIKGLVNGAFGLLILFVLVLWGLPFGAGFLAGRLVKKKQ